MKILLLSTVPPCRNWTGGLVLDQFCRFLPAESAACFVVTGGATDPEVSPEFSWMPIAYYAGPQQCVPSSRFASVQMLRSLKVNARLMFRDIPKLVDHVVGFAKDFGADMLWAVLEGPNVIRAALPAADRLGIPLITQVFDPPNWWLRQSHFDPVSSRQMYRQFDRTIRRSRSCAVVSQPMAEEYGKRYGVDTVVLPPCLDLKATPLPPRAPAVADRFTLGLAGQIYAVEEWKSLLRALESVGWRVAGREIAIRVIGRGLAYFVENHRAGGHIELLDWLPQEELIRRLAEMDAAYCPYWFDPVFENEARLSFPSKLVSYLAAGLPILFHGPDYASPARFLKANPAGLCCHSLERGAILRSIERLVADPAACAGFSSRGREAFQRYFTLDACRQSLQAFFGVEEDFLRPVSRVRSLAA
jgi:glycosyltransferase involved in cell wall biosynthesis